MVFGYYLPGITEDALTADVLRAAGLGDRLADIIATGDLEARLGLCGVNAAGPDGMSGLLITPIPLHVDVTPLRWKKDRQDAIHCGGFWLIADRENRPTPTGLERLSLIEGYAHRLGDGQVWQCPVITRAMHPINLPKVGMYEDGRWRAKVLPEYRHIWEESCYLSFRFMPENIDTPWNRFIGDETAYAKAMESLAVNYRVGPEELSYLRALTTDAVSQVLDAQIDLPFFLDTTQKKRASIVEVLEGWQSSMRGPAESTPTTSPAEPVSSFSDADTDATASTSPSQSP